MKRQRKNTCMYGMVLLLLFVFSGCDKDRNHLFSSPTSPDDVIIRSNFYAGETQEQGFGVYKGREYFLIQVPAGEYLLQYATQTGEFYIVFRAEKNALLFIGTAGSDVSKATIYPGRITDTSNPRPFGVVTVFSEFGAAGSGDRFFEKSNNKGVLLIGGVGIEYMPGESYFRLYIPLGGTYRLTYITQKGRFEIEFTVEDNATKEIGLSDGDIVQEAYIVKK